MARLQAVADGAEVVLCSTHQVGRATSKDLRIDDPRVSSDHAAIYWTSAGWMIRDFASRNGTFVNGRRLRPEERAELKSGDELSFAGPSFNGWRVLDVEAPSARAVELQGQRVIDWARGMLLFPGTTGSCVYRDPMGQWVFDGETRCERARNGQSVVVDGTTWKLELPEAGSSTARVQPVAVEVRGMKFDFKVSSDEEHVEVLAVGGGRRVDLGARAHNYVLLTLARIRLDEASKGIPAEAAGWIGSDALTRMLDMDVNALNVRIYRIRQQLRQAGIEDAANVVERRPGTGLMRIGSANLEIARV